MRDTQTLHLQRMPPGGTDRSTAGPMRIVVLDDGGDTVERIENALWVWPHKLLTAAHIEEAIGLSEQEPPAAILISIDSNKIREAKSIPALRRRLPKVPIVAVVSQHQAASSRRYFEQGADALLLREDVDRPTLHDLISGLASIRNNSPAAGRRCPPFELARPWRQSEIVGALVCDAKGTVLDANGTLAGWLGYADAEALRGRSLPREVLADRNDWVCWIQVAGDTAAFLRSELSLVTRDGRMLRLVAEAFAAPDSPSLIQAVFENPAGRAIAETGQA
jgi:PAS domain-containing protein